MLAKFTFVPAVLCLAAALGGCHKSGPPYGPEQALGMFRIESGWKIETFATEPDVVSPVAMDWDENGNLYVVEDRGYPLSVKEKLGRIKLLRDTDGDGRPDRVTIFADHLVMPTGVMRWKKGILVTDAPDVLYLEDTNGDGVADVRKVVLTGFPFTNPQHTVNGPVYGLDNWIYLAAENPATAIIFKEEFGDRGSDLRYPDRPDLPPLKERGRAVRFRPDTGELEALSVSSQFGQSFDDWGRHFLVSNSNHIRYEAVAARYLKRNPDLPVGTAVDDISDHGAAAKVYPITLHPRFELLSGVGEFTSACGILYYSGSTYVAEPAHGIVHRDVLFETGSIYGARRAQDGVEFLASTDSWFRPVNLSLGPDGALYLLDYYRLVIEHPEWMSTHHHHSPDLVKGRDRGRIYRLVPPAGVQPSRGIHLGSASNAELVKQLANANVWWRRTAQRLLVNRKAVEVVPELTAMARDGATPQGRVHALWTLEGLGKLDAAAIHGALRDPAPGVREDAIQLAELHLRQSPTLESDLLRLGADPDSRVRYQLELTLGFLHSAAARSLRDRLLFANLEDKWFQVAALSASSEDAPRLFEKAVASSGAESKGRSMLFRYLAAEIAARQKPAETERMLVRLASGRAWWAGAALEGFNMGLRAKHAQASNRVRELLLGLFESGDAGVRRATLRSLELTGPPAGAAAAVAHARQRCADTSLDANLRADSIGLVALAAPDENAALFRSLIDPHQPEVVQSAAVRAYANGKGPDVGAFLIKNWRAMTAQVRSDAADAMSANPARQKLLVAALKDGDIQPWTLSFRHKARLIMNPDPAIRDAARPLLEQTPADREAVVKRYQAALDRPGDAAKGREVFRSICAKCHRLEGYGAEVGPDLATVRNKPKEELLRDVLIPSQSIAQGYESYVVETFSGQTLDGVIGPQTPTTITLRHEEGKEDVVQRQDIRNMYATNLSAMPGDLEKQIVVRQMADLLEYLKSGR